jgi:hypothetical protein
MRKFRFTILGDNAEKDMPVPYMQDSPVLLKCEFYADDNIEDTQLNKFITSVIESFNNPQRVGAPMALGALEEIELNDL